MARSHGPDKLKNGYACYLHHSGERSFAEYNNTAVGSGQRKILMDYDCCCDPCLYIKSDFSEGGTGSWYDPNPDLVHCCSCNPRTIVVRWTPDDTGDTCDVYEQKEPLFYNAYSPDGYPTSVRYMGTIVNHPVAVYLSPFAVGVTGNITVDGSGCRWTMHVATGDTLAGGAVSDFEYIDHNDVTCLGVPNFSFGGISGFGGAGGTVSLENFDSSKVAFVKRDLTIAQISIQSNINYMPEDGMTAIPDYNGIYGSHTFSPAITGDMVNLPTGIIGPALMDSGFWTNPMGQYPTGVFDLITDCTAVPRHLCVKFDRQYNENPAGNILRYREYVYDTGFYPIQRAEFHPSYTGYEYITTGQVLAKWTYTPLNYSGVDQLPIGEQKRHLFLYETYVDEIARLSGDMELLASTGSPKYVFVPVDEGDTGVIARDHVWRDGAFYAHPSINFNSHAGVPAFINQNEEYYYKYGDNTTRTLFLGGNLTTNQISYGSGDSCPCTTRALGSYEDIGDDYTDYRYIRPGRCACWQYRCSDSCRCVPKQFCLLTAEATRNSMSTDIRKNTLTWDGDSCWVGGTGDISLCIESLSDIGYIGEETYNGVCGLRLYGGFFESGQEYVFPTEYPITCDSLSMTHSFDDTIFVSGTAIASMQATLFPTFGDCSSRTSCELATPCYLNCGSHPDAINVSFHAYSVAPDDDISGPFSPTGTSDFSVSLTYVETFFIVESDPITFDSECHYVGYAPCGSGIVKVVVTMNPGGSFPLVQFGDFTSSHENLDAPDAKEFFESYTESCDPYYFSGVMNPDGGGLCPFWLSNCGFDCGDGYGRFNMVITEA